MRHTPPQKRNTAEARLSEEDAEPEEGGDDDVPTPALSRADTDQTSKYDGAELLAGFEQDTYTVLMYHAMVDDLCWNANLDTTCNQERCVLKGRSATSNTHAVPATVVLNTSCASKTNAIGAPCYICHHHTSTTPRVYAYRGSGSDI